LFYHIVLFLKEIFKGVNLINQFILFHIQINMKKSVSFNEKMNEIMKYEKEQIVHLEDYLETINKYFQVDIKKDDYEYIILKNGKKIKKKVN